MKNNNLVLSVLGVALSAQAFAWGQIGHRAVCEIAEKKVSVRTRQALRGILGKRSLADSCTYMDDVRSHPDRATYGKYADWHFIEIPDGRNVENAPRSAKGDALEAMEKMEQKLKSRTGSALERFEALAFLGHLMGDVHQPLHVGNGLDRGANQCTVSYFKKITNLHSLWDDGMIEGRELSFTELARFVDILDPKVEAGYRNGDYRDWITESMQLRDSLYPQVTVDGNVVPGRPYCKPREEGPVPEKMIPQLGYEYAFQMKELQDRRLVQAGIRLAVVLDRIFSGSKMSRLPKGAIENKRLPASR